MLKRQILSLRAAALSALENDGKSRCQWFPANCSYLGISRLGCMDNGVHLSRVTIDRCSPRIHRFADLYSVLTCNSSSRPSLELLTLANTSLTAEYPLPIAEQVLHRYNN